MENSTNVLQIAQAPSNTNTIDYVTYKFVNDAPKAATFGIQVSIYVLAVILAISFIRYFLNRND
jgi:ABC-type transport system involved in multi-copper enzyme maturation permease subunit